ncbi:MAG TPA: methyltransferase [Clostridiales bacterium]|jgi:hypothetical protein|nr:methyltransferase [Clostridiales bacterium]
MRRQPFNPEKELKEIGKFRTFPSPMAPDGYLPRYDRPVTPRENFLAMLKGESPQWIPNFFYDIHTFCPRVIPDNVARGMVVDGEPMEGLKKGGLDMFGVEWEYEELVGGSMVKPGNPKCPDICEWEKYITFPDLDSWDWAHAAEVNTPYFDGGRPVEFTIFSGLFERLISFLDFEAAALALLDEDQQDAVHGLFDKLCDFYDDYIGYVKKYFPFVDIICFHDDWGSQRAPFFSLATCREMLVPYLKRVADSCHKNGFFLHLHCCGKNEMIVPAMVEAGVDMWIPQPMNDFDYLLRNFNDKLVLGVQPPELKEELDEEGVKEACKKYVESTLVASKPRVLCFASSALRKYPSVAKMLDYLYPISREYYSKL